MNLLERVLILRPTNDIQIRWVEVVHNLQALNTTCSLGSFLLTQRPCGTLFKRAMYGRQMRGWSPGVDRIPSDFCHFQHRGHMEIWEKLVNRHSHFWRSMTWWYLITRLNKSQAKEVELIINLQIVSQIKYRVYTQLSNKVRSNELILWIIVWFTGMVNQSIPVDPAGDHRYWNPLKTCESRGFRPSAYCSVTHG